MFGLWKKSKKAIPVKGRILVLDPDPTVGELIRKQFADEGLIVDCLLSAQSLSTHNLANYQLVIIDLSVNNGQGMRLVEQLKQQRTTSHLGVITTSNAMTPATIIRALNAGADDYLLKPFTPAELSSRINATLKNRELFDK